jgi:hypothetical protein
MKQRGKWISKFCTFNNEKKNIIFLIGFEQLYLGQKNVEQKLFSKLFNKIVA